MANVAGTTAQTVSDQMTAVWNNFYDGSKSLEYYSDVMVALGAATASSTDEISEGVNKFAAAAKTVGLSYEYATAALATITAKTRESADVVGNALKTIFSRLQGLTLGETLDDGTNLNKYSKALDAVGISIKTTDGQLKDMDTILDELGAKWQTLGQDQQMALAQTVAGVRQYAQLIALMNNYDYFKENLGVAYNAEGTLQEQADIYAESWAAAEKRVRASMEGLYQSLIDDKFFIGINNAIADAVSGLDAFIDAAGGLPTVLTTIGSIMLSIFANKMPEAFKNLKYNLDVFTKGADKAYQSVVKQMQEATKQGYEDYQKSSGSEGINPESSSGYALQAANDLTIARSKLSAVNDQLNTSEQQRYNTELGLIDQQQQEVIGLKQKAEALQDVIETLSNELSSPVYFDIENKIFSSVGQTITESLQDTTSFFDEIGADYDDFSRDIQQVGANINERLIVALRDGETGTVDLTNAFSKLTNHLKKLDLSTIDVSNFEDIRYQLLGLFDALPDGIKDVTGLSKEIRNLARAGDANEFVSSYQNLLKVLDQIGINSKDAFKGLQGLSNTADLRKLYEALQQLPKVQQEVKDGQERINSALNAFQPTHVVQGLEAITAGASGLGNVVSIINQLKGALSSLNNDDLTVGEKITSFFSSLAFIVPSTISFLKSYGTVVGWLNQQETQRVETQNAIIAAENTRIEQEAIAAQMTKARQGVELGLQATIKGSTNLYDLETFAIATGLTQEEARQALDKAGIGTMKIKNQIQQEVLAADQDVIIQKKEIIAQEVAETLARKNGNIVRKEAIVLSKALNKVSKIAMIISALVALGTILAQLIPKAKDTAKAFEEANSAYKEQQTVVNDLKSELEELNNTIDELRNKGPLSLIEQEQLNKAETQKAITEQQLKLEQQLLELRQQNAASAFIEDINNKKNQPEQLETQYVTFQGKNFMVSDAYTDKSQFGDFVNNIIKPQSKYTTEETIDAQNATKDFIKEMGEFFNLSKEEIDKISTISDTGLYENFADWYDEMLDIDDSFEDKANDFMSKNDVDPDRVMRNKVYINTATQQEKIDPMLLADLEAQFNEVIDKKSSSRLELLNSYKEYLSTYQDLFMQGAFDDNPEYITQSINFLKQYQDELWGDNKSQMYEDLGVNTYFGQSKNYEQVRKALLSTDDVSQIVDKVDDDFKKRLESMGFSVEDYFQNWIDRLAKIRESVSANHDNDFLNELFTSKDWKPEYLNYIEQVLQDGSFKTIEEVFAELDRIIAESANNIQDSLSSWKDSASKSMSIASKLKNIGDEISADEYASLGEEYRKYFDLQYDGTAILKTSAQEFYDVVKKGEEEKLKNQIDNTKSQLKNIDLKNTQNTLNSSNELFYVNQSHFDRNEGIIQNIKSSEDYQNLYESQGQLNAEETERFDFYNKQIQRLQIENRKIEQSQKGLAQQIENAQEVIDNFSGTEEELQAEMEALASFATSIDQLDEYLSAGYLDQNIYDKYYDTTLAKEASSLGQSYDQIKGLANSEYFKNLEGNEDKSAQELDKLALSYYRMSDGWEAFQSNWDKWDSAVQNDTSKIATEYIGSMQTALEHFLGTTQDLSSVLNDEFFIKNWELIKKAIDGDTEAAKDLLEIINDLLPKEQKISALDFAAMGGIPTTTQETKTWRSGYDERSKIISGLSTGGTLTKEEYDKLTDNEQAYFLDMYDGTYKLIGAAEDFKKLANDIEVQNIKSGLEQATGMSQEELANRASLWGNEQFLLTDYKNNLIDNAASYFGIKQESFQTLEEYAQAVREAIEASQALQATTAENLNALQKMDLSQSAFVDGLIQLASSYENCQDELEDYVKTQRQYGKTSDQAKKAATNLQRAIRNEEWKKVTKECKEYIDTLDDLVDIDDIEDAFSSIAKSFNNTFDTNITKEFVSKNIDLFKEWAESSGDEANDLAQKIYYLANIESNLNDVELSINTDKVENQLGGVQNMADWLKGYIESNPITVDAYGRADLSDLLSSMIGAGATAEQLAAALALLGEAEIDTSAWGTGMASSYPGTIEGMLAFINDLTHFHGGFSVNENGQVSASAAALADTFGSHKTYGTGGRAMGSTPKTSSGGGGGSSKHAEKKNDSDKERYHTVLNQLEDLNAEYDDISKAKDRAFGKDRLDYMDAEIKKTDELIAKQGEYLDEIKGYLPVDKAVMEAYYKDLINGPEMLFDEKGNISNFDAIQDAMYAKYNQMTDLYTDDDTNWEIFEKKYEQLEKYIEQYEETYDLLRDEEQKYQDLINQRIDAQLEKVQYKVEVKLDVSQDELAVLEYQLGRINDDAFKSIDAIGILFDKSLNLEKQIEINKQGLNDALGLSLSLAEISEVMAGNLSVLDGKNFTSDQIDAIKEYRDNLLDLNEQLDDVRENIEEKVLESFDAWNEKLNTGVEILDNYGSVLDHFKNMIDIVGQDNLGLDEDFMSNLGQGAVDNAINKVRATKDIMESVMKAQEQAQKSLEEARANGDQKSQEMWEDTLKQLDEEARSAQDTFLQAWEDALSGLADQFEQTVNRVVKDFNNAVYQVGGLEGLANDFSQQKDDSDMMLDDYQKIYELSKLSRDINKTIDDTDVISGKQKLKKLLEQVNDLQADGVEMSQYDLEYLQKTYDLRLAELELEEAQRAKNTVRLQKDNEGNWSYIYTQSSDAIDSAQQKYEDALYAMQDLSSNYIDEMSEKLIDTSQEMADALAALRVEDFASLDDYYKEVERVQNLYQDRMALQEEELNKAIANNKELYDTDWMNYHNATGYKISDTENFATAFKDTLLGALMDSDTDSSNFTDLLGQSVQDLTAGLLGAAETYYINLENAMNAAGTSTSGFGEDVTEAIDQITAKSDEGAQAVEDMAERMNTAMSDVMSTVEEWQQTYGQAMEEIIQSNLEVIESFNEMIKALGADASNIKINYDITRGTSSAERFATGGYTGEWGSSGKLGILDEKELILNQNDTANMLSAIQLTREIMNAIDIGANYASLGFGNLVATSLRDSNRETLEQNVHITAEFPNVNDHNEIELALKNLTNTASQYANRK